MVLAALVLTLSTALFFYLQGTLQSILRRQFDREYFLAIVNANRLEFPAVRKELEEFNAPVDSLQLLMRLKCDFRALTYLLRNAANVNQHYSHEERFVMLYFRLVFVSLITRHWLRLREKPVILMLTAILQYFANVVGQRIDRGSWIRPKRASSWNIKHRGRPALRQASTAAGSFFKGHFRSMRGG
jgi:hypothetical protein